MARKVSCAMRLEFLYILSETGNVRFSAEIVGLSKTSLYNYRRNDVVFASGWVCALRSARLKGRSLRRCVRGVRSYYRGKLIRGDIYYPDDVLGEIFCSHSSARLEKIERFHEFKKFSNLLENVSASLRPKPNDNVSASLRPKPNDNVSASLRPKPNNNVSASLRSKSDTDNIAGLG